MAILFVIVIVNYFFKVPALPQCVQALFIMSAHFCVCADAGAIGAGAAGL